MQEVKPPEECDAWVDAVLRQNSRPYWLEGDAPQGDVALSSRARLMRNLAGFSFPNRATRRELETVQAAARSAIEGFEGVAFTERSNVSRAEAAVLVGSRLVSPDFQWGAPGRSIFLDASRSISVMVNEEDHLRIQAVTPGFSPGFALGLLQKVESVLSDAMQFAQGPVGYLATFPSNSGKGRRVGAMLHLIGFALSGRKPDLGNGFEVRGLLGESSTGLGSFVQVSTPQREPSELQAGIEHLMSEERKMRQEIGEHKLREGVDQALEQMQGSGGLSLWKATNLVSWLRLGACYGVYDRSQRELDALLALLTLGPPDEPTTNVRRKRLVARFLELTLPWASS
jgi:protein arginine kinase